MEGFSEHLRQDSIQNNYYKNNDNLLVKNINNYYCHNKLRAFKLNSR